MGERWLFNNLNLSLNAVKDDITLTQTHFGKLGSFGASKINVLLLKEKNLVVSLRRRIQCF